jgi:hypothetical protein
VEDGDVWATCGRACTCRRQTQSEWMASANPCPAPNQRARVPLRTSTAAFAAIAHQLRGPRLELRARHLHQPASPPARLNLASFELCAAAPGRRPALPARLVLPFPLHRAPPVQTTVDRAFLPRPSAPACTRHSPHQRPCHSICSASTAAAPAIQRRLPPRIPPKSFTDLSAVRQRPVRPHTLLTFPLASSSMGSTAL